MSLVAYPSSEEEDDHTPTPPAKKRKLSGSEQRNTASDLPPLPPTFLDQYSSTVRTSNQDDPSLHGGRKRVTPHVQGNWPTHVYLEWYPGKEEAGLLSEVVAAAQQTPVERGKVSDSTKSSSSPHQGRHQRNSKHAVHSLLQNDLGVPLPLHISLSRPLALKTDQKDAFLTRLRQLLSQDSGIKSVTVHLKDLIWHPNETNTRWFLVLRVGSTSALGEAGEVLELRRLLERCNDVARAFEQPLLYAEDERAGEDDDTSKASQRAAFGDEHFHISIAWSLQPPGLTKEDCSKKSRLDLSNGSSQSADASGLSNELLDRLTKLALPFTEVKVRIGQDVHRIPLKTRRRSPGIV